MANVNCTVYFREHGTSRIYAVEQAKGRVGTYGIRWYEGTRQRQKIIGQYPVEHFRLSSADDACEHLYILIMRSSLGPSPPNAGRYTVASRFRRRSFERGYIVQGLQNGSLPPRSALQATCDGTHGLIEFLLSRQSFSAALQVALRLADHTEVESSISGRMDPVSTMASERMDCSGPGHNFTTVGHAVRDEVFFASLHWNSLAAYDQRIAALHH